MGTSKCGVSDDQTSADRLKHIERLILLSNNGVSYIIADNDENMVRESLEKLKTIYGVEKLVLTGGAAINGGFLKEDMIDEFSVVILPYIDGNETHKSLVDTKQRFFENAFMFSEAKPLQDGAVHMIFKRRREE